MGGEGLCVSPAINVSHLLTPSLTSTYCPHVPRQQGTGESDQKSLPLCLRALSAAVHQELLVSVHKELLAVPWGLHITDVKLRPRNILIER